MIIRDHGTKSVLISTHTDYQEAQKILEEKEDDKYRTSLRRWNCHYDDCSDHPGWFSVKEIASF